MIPENYAALVEQQTTSGKFIPFDLEPAVRYPDVFIHPLAVMDDTCTIGAGTRIWSGALVRNGTRLGANVSVGVNCALEGCTVGDDTHLNPNAHIPGAVVIGARCFIGTGVCFLNDAWPSVNRDAFGGWKPYEGWTCIAVGDDTAVGSAAVIMAGVTIGARCMIAAQACVTENIPDDCLYTRENKIKTINPAHIQRMRVAT